MLQAIREPSSHTTPDRFDDVMFTAGVAIAMSGHHVLSATARIFARFGENDLANCRQLPLEVKHAGATVVLT